MQLFSIREDSISALDKIFKEKVSMLIFLANTEEMLALQFPLREKDCERCAGYVLDEESSCAEGSNRIIPWSKAV